MVFNKDDIKFDELSPSGFENLCYDLLVKSNFQNLVWRRGGSDSGRDIEGTYIFQNSIRNKEVRWFFECKHYLTGGVPPEHLSSKIAWADAEKPGYLVFILSSYLTNGARTWLEKINAQGKPYDIIVIEGEELKDRLSNFPDLVEQYFSIDRYLRMLAVLKDHKLKYNIEPSYEFLKEIIPNIDPTKLDLNDIGFLLNSFYSNYNLFGARTDYYDDFDPYITDRILYHLRETTKNEELTIFKKFADYEEVSGIGFFSEYDYYIMMDREHPIKQYDFQYYGFNLAFSRDWKQGRFGEYLLIIYMDVAFEIFTTDKTEVRIIRDFTRTKMDKISLNNSQEFRENYIAYTNELKGTNPRLT
ncbi:restriction endonuclease [Niabella sp. CJ426]|uniref:restriction endonuclease n=1 Tax=Niabella sp. CJ426 TaxID=3393740 RepID=UPI003D034C9B